MDRKTLKALRGSIKKWMGIVAGTVRNEGVENCPLCQLFYIGKNDDTACRGCPVFEETGETGCQGTPYVDYTLAEHLRFHFSDRGRAIARKSLKPCAKRELKFLQSLLPRKRK
jgi:hypothetical protein